MDVWDLPEAPLHSADTQQLQIAHVCVCVQLVLNHVVDWKMDASEITAAAAAGEVVQTEVDNLLGFGKGNAGDLYVTPEDTHIRAQVQIHIL